VARAFLSGAAAGGRRALARTLATTVVALSAACSWAASPQQKPDSADSAAGTLVQAALQSELAGHNDQRETLLRHALAQSPSDAAAHWQLGQVRKRGGWQSIGESRQAAQKDKRLAEYARRRDAAGASIADQAALARWCRKNRLDRQQRVHWMRVLQAQPDHAEAIRSLGLKPYRGMMLTSAQIEQLRAQLQTVRKASDAWRLPVANWRSAAERGDATVSTAIREKLAKISDSAEMRGVELALWRQLGGKQQARLYRTMLFALMPVLGNNPQPAAAESLARHAVFADMEEVRAAAIAGLKRHPLDHYVPLLLSGLQSRIEAEIHCSLSAAGDLVTKYSVLQEGAFNYVSYSLVLAPVYADGELLFDPNSVPVAPGTGTVVFDGPATKPYLMRYQPGRVATAYAKAQADLTQIPRLAAEADAANAAAIEANRQLNAENSRTQAAQSEAAFHAAVERANRAITARNARIAAALCQTTGQDVGDQPTKWWTWWWWDYNEQYSPSLATDDQGGAQPTKPEYHYDDYAEYGGSAPRFVGPPIVGGPVVLTCSCFAPGTKVSTLTGVRPIEKIKVGDCVLAQDCQSGELAYKPVLAVTTRPPGPRFKIAVGSDQIVATPGHPFWVVGQGWRLTKQLKVGDRLHATSGGLPIKRIEKLDPDPVTAGYAYNLIVADFNSYFVGERAILVHDNTPRQPTAALVPGWRP
jgi:hypothetical protein